MRAGIRGSDGDEGDEDSEREGGEGGGKEKGKDGKTGKELKSCSNKREKQRADSRTACRANRKGANMKPHPVLQTDTEGYKSSPHAAKQERAACGRYEVTAGGSS